MTIANKHEEAVLLLTDNQAEAAREALRFIKNSIIGNPTRKNFYLKQLNLAPRSVC
jgi:hypothetical protein